MTNPAPGFVKHPHVKMSIEPFTHDIVAKIDGMEIGRTVNALILREADYSPVYYLPLSVLAANMLVQSDYSTYCPFKGQASYYHLEHDGRRHENAVWTYAEPYDEALAIKDHIAIFPRIAAVEPV